MGTIVTVEIVCAIFVSLLLAGQITEHGRSKSSIYLRHSAIVILLALIIDILAYVCLDPVIPLAFRYIVCLLAYANGGIVALSFTLYSEAYIAEKTELNPWIFRIPKIGEVIWVLATAAAFIAGKIIVYENGLEAADYGFPTYILIFQMAVLFYTPAVIIISNRKIGKDAIILLSLLNVAPILGTLASITIDYDYTYVFGTVALVLVTELLQRKQVETQRLELERERQTQHEMDAARKLAAENNARLFALEDDFESLYDVELESGNYSVIVKGDFYRNIVLDKLAVPKDYFKELRGNIDAVIYPEDRDELYNTLNREALANILPEKEHSDHYYRIITEDGPVWFKMRIVYKNADRKNIIIGVFNAAEEMAAKERDEQLRQELITQMGADDGVILIDCVNDRKTVIHDRVHEKDEFSESDRYTESITRYIELFVAEPDRAVMRKMTAREYMLERAKAQKEYTVRYREFLSGDVCFFEMHVSRFTDTEVLQSFRNIDVKVYSEMAQSAIFDDFFAIYVADLSSDIIRVVKRSDTFRGDSSIMASSYSRIVGEYISGLTEKNKAAWSGLETTDGVRCFLAEQDKREIIYESAYRKNELTRITWYVLKRADGEADTVCLAFSNLDAEQVDKIRLNEQITEQKEQLEKQQERIEEALALAQSASKAKTDFLFNMSHDIRTPMNAITGFTAMAKKYSTEPVKVADYLDKIDTSGHQLLALVNQVLEMARIESGKIEFDETPVNVCESYSAMVTVLSEQAQAKGLKFIHTLGNIEHNNLLADEARMSSITLNIAGNAMKYTPEGGTVEYFLREIPARKPGYATFVYTVSDTGIGMSKEYLSELYEPFSREKTSTVSRIQGTGLGLSIVKSIIDLMGGVIEVQSEPGKGTRFDITVDFKIDPNGGNTAVREEAAEAVSFRNRRVLLVEDNEMNREIARDILEEQGMIVEDAEDGDIAVSMVRSIFDRGDFHYYDFILMDIQMPRMNGFEATKAIRGMEEPAGVHIPIIAMTANAFEEDRQNALAAGMDEHLAKPIDVRLMFRTITKFL